MKMEPSDRKNTSGIQSSSPRPISRNGNEKRLVENDYQKLLSFLHSRPTRKQGLLSVALMASTKQQMNFHYTTQVDSKDPKPAK